MIRLCAALLAALVSMSVSVMAADYPAPQDGEWIAKDFKFHSGEVMPELRLHYKNGRVDLIPASSETRGHLTTGDAKFYARQLQELLQTAPQRTM